MPQRFFAVLFFSLLNILLMVSLDFSSESHNNNSIRDG